MPSAGPLFVDRMAAFATLHDRRGNVLCHAAAVPLLFLAATVLLGLVRVPLGRHLVLTASDLAWIGLAVAWLRLDLQLGAVTAVAALPVLLLGNHLAAEGWVDGLLAVVTFAILGLGCELAGHAIEASRPAVLTDRRAVVVAPLFLVASAAFALGRREQLADDIDARVRRALAHPASYEPLAGL